MGLNDYSNVVVIYGLLENDRFVRSHLWGEVGCPEFGRDCPNCGLRLSSNISDIDCPRCHDVVLLEKLAAD